MKLFKKPDWLKPEINEPKYWLHLVIVVYSALLVLKYIFDHDMLSYVMFFKVLLAVSIGDIIAHTVLKLD